MHDESPVCRAAASAPRLGQLPAPRAEEVHGDATGVLPGQWVQDLSPAPCDSCQQGKAVNEPSSTSLSVASPKVSTLRHMGPVNLTLAQFVARCRVQ